MAYTIKRTNGLVIATIADSDAVTTSVNTNYSVALLGKHSPNYGEIFNTNFIRLLENSANFVAPGTPVVGQLWFDTTPSNLGLNVCITEASGSTPAAFNPVALLTRSATAPGIYGLGKLWHDTTTNQLRSYNGSGIWVPIGVTNLDSLTDVTITTPTDGQVLKYNSATSTWVNGTDATGGGGGSSLPADAAGVLTNNGTGTLSWTAVGGSALPDQTNQGNKFLKTSGTAASWANIAYSELTGKPTIPAAQIQSDWSQTDTAAADFIRNKPSLGGGASYALPIASNVLLGGIQVGSTLTVNSTTGQLNVPTATGSTLGVVKVDGTSITIDSSTGVISANAGAAIAGIATGAVGSYIFGGPVINPNTLTAPNYNVNDTIAGSQLGTYYDAQGRFTAGGYMGTWRCVGYSKFIPYAIYTTGCGGGSSGCSPATYTATLWLRTI